MDHTTRPPALRRASSGATPRRRQLYTRTALAAAALTLLSTTPASALTVNNEEPPGVEGFQQILNWGGWMVTVLGVLGLFAVGGGMILQHRRGEGGEQVGKLGLVLGGLIVAVAAGPLVNALA